MGLGEGFRLLDQRNPASSGQGQHLAFVVPYIRDSSVSTILVGFQQVAEEAGFSVVFNHVENDVQQQREVIQKLVAQDVMGIALYPVNSDAGADIEKLARAHYPIVLVDRYMKHFSTDYVMTDHFGGALRGVHYLYDQGHHRIGFVTWLSPAISMDHRLLGYRQALRECDIEPEASLICQVEGYPTVDRTPLITYLSNPSRPTAIFAANDQIAIALYRAAGSVGLRIPQDLSIIGFDNLDIAAHLNPPLTTVAQPFFEIGRQAAQILVSRLQGERDALQQITLAPQLIIRESSAPGSHFSEHSLFLG